MRAPLSVRVNDGFTDRHVTRHVRDLRFTKTAPGGHHSASIRLLLPHDTFRDLGPADRVYIYDARTGRPVWEGYAESPVITGGPTGQEYDLSAMGGMVLASDESRALVYIDRGVNLWRRDEQAGVAASTATEATIQPNGSTEGLLCHFLPGQPIGTGHTAQIAYAALGDAAMELGAVNGVLVSGKDAGLLDWTVESVYNGPSAGTTVLGLGMSTTEDTFAAYVGSTALPAGITRYALRLRRAGGATNVADDNTWTFFKSVAILGRRVNRYGTLLTGGGSAGMRSVTHVRATWVIEDLLGRVLTNCDPATAVIDTTTFDIDQLAYHDGATVQQVLEDLALYEPDFLWEILESNGDGKHRFNYRAWPTSLRYEISTGDGYEAPGGEVDLCNRIAVYWIDKQGVQQTTVVTSVVPELDSVGRTRDAEPVTLPEGRGSTANAQRLGEQILAAKASPPKAARATVTRPLLDHRTGQMVAPWEIEPGYLVRVRETGDNLRLTEMTYSDQDGAATLTLGEPMLTIEQRIARLSRKA